MERLNLSIDLQMLLTALCVRCHSSHTAVGCSPVRSMQPLPQVSTVTECWESGECRWGHNLYIYTFFSHRKENYINYKKYPAGLIEFASKMCL